MLVLGATGEVSEVPSLMNNKEPEEPRESRSASSSSTVALATVSSVSVGARGYSYICPDRDGVTAELRSLNVVRTQTGNETWPFGDQRRPV